MVAKTFNIIVFIPETNMDDASFQSALQDKLNEIVNDSVITSTTHDAEQ